MSDPFIFALIALGLSIVASLVRMIDWFIHSDPKVIARTTRWAATAIAALSVPLLVILLFKEQSTAAVVLGAAMVLVPTLLGWRILGWTAFRPLSTDGGTSSAASCGNGSGEGVVSDPELVRRSAAVLEAYLRHISGPAAESGANLPAIAGRADWRAPRRSGGRAAGPFLDAMSEQEALAILGLEAGATELGICDAHQRIAHQVHPDQGGSHYLSIKVNQAKEILLQGAAETSARASR
ncbi:heat shock protein DnaJ domain protein [Methylocella silvestris BL2]|uniref:Heat shock protein DnaJ domain protein n=1 Tax=Methylocella silvestris (strain DSM 15510 / CIP 108128 / LMG 27833 / NCIMB 13906 / BL2) TaxID=395965 RepID=B8EMU3_METSB|nr:heat shock protein DnaJ domain-containing protein [Methylocella silvestris]ACK52772.1 heat shock protein DnaJ domain protein [Methylocella silvestris BL2]